MKPDWVLMDIKMAPMDGITATNKIRNLYPDANIIIVTDYDDANLKNEARAAGAVGYVLKENLTKIGDIIKF